MIRIHLPEAEAQRLELLFRNTNDRKLPLADTLRQWIIQGPASQGLDRANGTPAEIADHLLKTQSLRTSRSAVQRFCAQIDIRLYRPTYRYLRGNPEQQARAQEDLAELGKKQRPGTSSC